MVQPVKMFAIGNRPTKKAGGYKDREGDLIDAARWESLRSDESYSILGNFENEKVKIRAEWVGKPHDPKVMEEYWEIYSLEVWNWYEDKWVLDTSSRYYYSETQMMAQYRAFLKRYTECHDDEEGNFVEVGNKLVPPDPNKAAGAEENTFIGSW